MKTLKNGIKVFLSIAGVAVFSSGLISDGYAVPDTPAGSNQPVDSVSNVSTGVPLDTILHTGGIHSAEITPLSESNHQAESNLTSVLRLGINSFLAEEGEGYRLKTVEEMDHPAQATLSTKTIRKTRALLEQDPDLFRQESVLDVSLTLEEDRDNALTGIEVELPRQHLILKHSTDADENTETTIQLKKSF